MRSRADLVGRDGAVLDNDAEDAIDLFEMLWRTGRRPVLDEFIAQGECRRALVCELVLIDLEYRLRRGEDARIEEYLRDWPQLAGDGEALVALVKLESRWRHISKQNPEQEEYRTRFPLVGQRLDEALSDGCPLTARWKIEEVLDAQDTARTNQLDDLARSPATKASNLAADRRSQGSTTAPPSEIGRFRVVAELGQGSFGTVYKAIDKELGRAVALKVPRAGLFDTVEQRERLLREAKSAALLHHPHIVPIYEVGSIDGCPFVVSALIQGKTLAQVLSEGTVDVGQAVETLERIASALTYAHDRGIIHRDVKPSNIMLDEQRVPYLMDFGLAKHVAGEAGLTVEGQILGTPAYMSPEQAAGDTACVDARTDLYSLGVVMFEMLAGERPFRGSVRMLLYQVMHDEPASPRALNDRIPRDLATICLKCLQKMPTARYASASELSDDLRRFLRGEPIHARPVTVFERCWRWARRRPKTAGLAATVLALLASLAIVWTTAALKINAARARSDDQARQTNLARVQAASLNQESLRRFEKLLLANGNARISAGDPGGALPWLVRASSILHPSAMSAVDRVRLSTTLAQCADVVAFWRFSGSVVDVKNCPTSSRLAVATTNREAFLVDGAASSNRLRRLSHDAMVSQCTFARDGRLLATVSNDGTVKIWDTDKIWGTDDAADAKPLATLQHPDRPTWAEFHPTRPIIITACMDSAIRVWHPHTGSLLRTLPRHSRPIRQLCLSPTSSLAASASDDGTVRLWSNPEEVDDYDTLMHDGPVNQVAFSVDGTRLVTASEDHTSRIWKTASCSASVVLTHESPVQCAAIAPSGALIATGTLTGMVRIWDAATGTLRHGPFEHEERVVDVAFSEDGQLLSSNSYDGIVRVWSTATGEPDVAPLHHGQSVSAAVLLEHGTKIVTGSFDGTVRVWGLVNPSAGELRVAEIEPLVRITASRDATRLLLVGSNGVTRIVELGPLESTVLAPYGDEALENVALSSDGKLLAAATRDGRLHVVDADTGRSLAFSSPVVGGIEILAFSPSGDCLLIGSSDGAVRRWDMEAKEPWLHLGNHPGMKSICFAPNGKSFLTIDGSHVASRYDAMTGRLIVKATDVRLRGDMCLFLPDGRSVVSLIGSRQALIWDAGNGNLLERLAHRAEVLCAAASWDGLRVVTGSDDNTACVWDANTGTLLSVLAHRHNVTGCVFNQNGTLVATTCDDLTARIWDPLSGDSVTPPLQHPNRLLFLAFSASGNELITAAADGVVRRWPLDNPACPTEQLILKARLFSGHIIDDSGSLVPLTPEGLEQDWNASHELMRRDDGTSAAAAVH